MTGPDRGRALVVGEALIDVVEHADGTVSRFPGGSPANVALGLGRLGRAVDLLTWLGPDADGDLVRAHLAASGVRVLPGDATRTSTARARLDRNGTASYRFDLEWDLPDPSAEPAGPPLVVHTGSIAGVLEPGATRVAATVARHRDTATVTYDPNLRPALMGTPEKAAPHVEALVALADVVKVSDEDLAWYAPGTPDHEVVRRWAASGPGLVVVTRGGAGAWAVTRAGVEVEVAPVRVEVVDTVGAGDSFMAGLIDGLWSAGVLGAHRRDAVGALDRSTVAAVLERCAAIAAITVSRAGADPPRRDELAPRGPRP